MASTTLSGLLDLAQRLIRIPSENPPGNEGRIACFVADWLHDAGVDTRFVPLEADRCSLVARIPGRRPGSVILCGHLDTVPTEPDAWSVPPFEGRTADGRLWGLGAADMKGAVAVLMHVAAQFSQSKSPPQCDIVLALTADEEVGYRGAATVAESGLIDDAKLLLVAEPTAGHVYTGQKGELWIEVAFHGREAHGSTPELGTSAILPAAQFCAVLHEEISARPEAPGRGRTTLNVGQFAGGRRANIVPDRAVLQLDLRTVRPEDRDELLALIDRIGEEEAAGVGARFERRILSDHAPILASPEAAILLTSAIAEQTGKPAPLGIAPFSTDAVSIVPKLDLPVIIYGPGDIAQAHRPDESVAVEQLVTVYETLVRFLEGRN